MFENRLKDLDNKLSKDNIEFKYFILTNGEREIYFKNTSKAVDFIKFKFDNSIKKKIIYYLIKIGMLQPFLKTIKLNNFFGDLIFIGGQIKCFDLNKEVVTSFPLYDFEDDFFIKNKLFQMKLTKGYSPKIYELNKERDYPFTKEELLERYTDGNYLKVFKKLYSFYEKYGIYRKNGLLYVKSHGDFSKEQLLKKGNEIVFIDWNDEDMQLITKDLYDFFIRNSKEKNPLKNKDFLEVLNIYPIEVKNNIKKYIELNSKDWKEELHSAKMAKLELKK